MNYGNYEPGTLTSRRRPTPTEFVHLRSWIDVDEKSIDITNIANLKNINLQLEQTSKLYASNVISRAIAQLMGSYGDGFVTLEATEDGELKVHLAASTNAIGSLAAGSELIGKVEVAGSSRTVLKAKIDFSTAATHEIIAAVAGKKIKVCNLMLTVAGDTNLTLKSATTALSGALDFGGTNEPRGMVHGFGDFPLETASGEAFQITSSGAVQVSGYVTYFTE
ncbi:MAG: hypothetical protein U9Q35_14460 [Pseudomonadota bacterium]|nr:hypothetical protein [Pseudomonadota bacterium]